MKNNLDTIILEIVNNVNVFAEEGIDKIYYNTNPPAPCDDDILHIRVGKYLTTFKVVDGDVKMNAMIEAGKQEIATLSDMVAHLTVTVYLEAIKPYVTSKHVPVAILPRGIREIFDALAVRLSNEHPDVSLSIIDEQQPERNPQQPARIKRLKA